MRVAYVNSLAVAKLTWLRSVFAYLLAMLDANAGKVAPKFPTGT
jgi:hypothetical protein